MTLDPTLIDDFIDRWKVSGGNEMANFQSFAGELVVVAHHLQRENCLDLDGLLKVDQNAFSRIIDIIDALDHPNP